MDYSQKEPAIKKPKHPRSFTFIDQKTHLLPKTELTSVRRHISTEASQRRKTGPRKGQHQARPSNDGVQLVTIIDEKGEKEDPGDIPVHLINVWRSSATHSSRRAAPVNLETYLPGGRIDSLGILALPAKDRRELELMDYMINVIWPCFCERDSDGSLKPFARHWLQRASNNPAVLHGFLYSASSHIGSRPLLISDSSTTAPKLLQEQLYHQSKAMEALREQLENIEDATTDDVSDCVTAILCLATYQRQDTKFFEPDETPFHPPLASAGWLNIFGLGEGSEIHWNAVQRLVKANHGLIRTARFGFHWAISYADIMRSTAMLKSPEFENFDIRGNPSEYTPYRMFGKAESSVSVSQQCSDKRGCGFVALLDLGFEKHHVQPFIDLADFSTILAAYQFGILPRPNISEIASNRNVVQHQLLSLSSMSELEKTEKENALFYETCRLTALLYSVMVTFPIPRSNDIREALLHKLKESMTQQVLVSAIMLEERRELLDMFIWCLVIGGIAALGKEELGWFVGRTRCVVFFLQLRSWSDIEAKLRNFAWLKSACNPGAITFWALVMEDRSPPCDVCQGDKEREEHGLKSGVKGYDGIP